MIPEPKPGEAPLGPDDDEREEGLEDSDPDSGLLDEVESEPGPGEEDRGEEDDGGQDGSEGTRQAQVKKPTRGEVRFQTLSNRVKEAERRAQEAERRAEEASRLAQGRQTAEQEALERQRLELMSPDEKLTYFRQKDKQELDQRFAQMQFMQADNMDRAAFERLCTRKPFLDFEEVESELQLARRSGLNPSRETIAYYILGKRAADKAARAKPKQQRKAEEGRARETVRPARGGSDVQRGGERLSEKAARAKRLENMEL